MRVRLGVGLRPVSADWTRSHRPNPPKRRRGPSRVAGGGQRGDSAGAARGRRRGAARARDGGAGGMDPRRWGTPPRDVELLRRPGDLEAEALLDTDFLGMPPAPAHARRAQSRRAPSTPRASAPPHTHPAPPSVAGGACSSTRHARARARAGRRWGAGTEFERRARAVPPACRRSPPHSRPRTANKFVSATQCSWESPHEHRPGFFCSLVAVLQHKPPGCREEWTAPASPWASRRGSSWRSARSLPSRPTGRGCVPRRPSPRPARVRTSGTQCMRAGAESTVAAPRLRPCACRAGAAQTRDRRELSDGTDAVCAGPAPRCAGWPRLPGAQQPARGGEALREPQPACGQGRPAGAPLSREARRLLLQAGARRARDRELILLWLRAWGRAVGGAVGQGSVE